MKNVLTTADALIGAELARQQKMWGDRTDDGNHPEWYANCQLQLAATAQLVGLKEKQAGVDNAFGDHSLAKEAYYPSNWSGLRDYGSDVANLVVAAAFIHNEINRLITAGADTTRTERDPKTQPYDEASAPAASAAA